MSRYNRTLLIVNLTTKTVIHTRHEDVTGSAARVTKPLYDLLTDSKHIAFYAHQPTKIRVPVAIKGRFYVKPAGWKPKA